MFFLNPNNSLTAACHSHLCLQAVVRALLVGFRACALLPASVSASAVSASASASASAASLPPPLLGARQLASHVSRVAVWRRVLLGREPELLFPRLESIRERLAPSGVDVAGRRRFCLLIFLVQSV